MASLKLGPEYDTDSWVDLEEGVLWVIGKGQASTSRVNRERGQEGPGPLPLRRAKQACASNLYLRRPGAHSKLEAASDC